MIEQEVETLVTAWLEFQHTPENTPEWTARRPIVDEFDALCTSDPGRSWTAILRILEIESDEEVLSALAAAPLEDLLSRHGEAFIERVEQQAQADSKFRGVLSGVWQISISDEIWLRVQAAPGRAAT